MKRCKFSAILTSAVKSLYAFSPNESSILVSLGTNDSRGLPLFRDLYMEYAYSYIYIYSYSESVRILRSLFAGVYVKLAVYTDSPQTRNP